MARINTPSRFWSHVDKSGGETACWPWIGCRDKNGYGKTCWDYEHIRTHRKAWELVHGEIGELHVLHKCDNPPCCNPAHLFLGTNLDNNADKVAKGRVPSGLRHGTKTKPESVKRGDAHWMRHMPERVRRGERHGRAKLTADNVVEIRRLYATGWFTLKQLSAQFGVTFGVIWSVVQRKTWKSVA